MFYSILLLLLSISLNINDPLTDTSYEDSVKSLDLKYELNKQEINDLSREKRITYYKELEKLKSIYNKDYNNVSEHKIASPGDIFLTTSSKTFGIRHGHAAINSDRDFETIESDNLRPVARYPNQVNRYWKTTVNSKRYQVIGASQQETNLALDNAIKQIGKPYCILPFGDTCYFCTKLIWSAWDSTDTKNKIGHYYFAPDMMKSKSLKLVESYID